MTDRNRERRTRRAVPAVDRNPELENLLLQLTTPVLPKSVVVMHVHEQNGGMLRVHWHGADGMDDLDAVALGGVFAQPDDMVLCVDVNGTWYAVGTVAPDDAATLPVIREFGGSGVSDKAARSDHIHAAADITSGIIAHARLPHELSFATATPVAGRYIGPATHTLGMSGSSTISPNANQTYSIPFIPPFDMTVDAMVFEVTTAAAGALVKAAIWASRINGFPTGTPVATTADIDAGTTGVKVAATTAVVTLTKGTVYWLGLVASVNTVAIRVFTPARSIFQDTIQHTSPRAGASSAAQATFVFATPDNISVIHPRIDLRTA